MLLDKKELDENELDKSELRRKCTRRNVTEPLKRAISKKNICFIPKVQESLNVYICGSLFKSYIKNL